MTDEQMKSEKGKDESAGTKLGLPIGAGIGVALGAGVGVAFGNVASVSGPALQ